MFFIGINFQASTFHICPNSISNSKYWSKYADFFVSTHFFKHFEMLISVCS